MWDFSKNHLDAASSRPLSEEDLDRLRPDDSLKTKFKHISLGDNGEHPAGLMRLAYLKVDGTDGSSDRVLNHLAATIPMHT